MAQIYDPSPDEAVYQSVRTALETARTKAAAAVNDAMVSAYWEIGRQIVEAQGDRAEYGQHLMEYLSERLTAEFGKGFTERNLQAMRQFYQAFPIPHTLCAELSWSHYRLIIRIDDPVRRDFYVRSAVEERWTVRQLDRQIHSFYYERLLATRAEGKDEVRQEIQNLEPPTKADGILKDPYVLDFLDLNGNSNYLETDLEQALMDKLQQFLLELGKGFSFVARQQRVSADGDHYYIDLVFYHYVLKCFVLIDLKTGKLTPQDVGQMDFYVRLFDDQCTQPDDNPTIGIVLCANRNEAVAKYSVLADKKGIFASQYVLCLPTEEELSQALEATCLLASEEEYPRSGEESSLLKHALGAEGCFTSEDAAPPPRMATGRTFLCAVRLDGVAEEFRSTGGDGLVVGLEAVVGHVHLG